MAALRLRPGLWEAWHGVLAELNAPDPGWSQRKDLRRVAESLAWRALTDAAERRGLTRPAAQAAAARQLGCRLDTLTTRERPYRGNSLPLPSASTSPAE